MTRRRPLLRAVAIGGGAYLDGMLRIEATRLVDELQRLTSRIGEPTRKPDHRGADR